MSEHEKAKAWRESLDLSIAQLATLSGYSKEALYWMERGRTPTRKKGSKPGKIDASVWQRYRNVCAGVDAQLRARRTFSWEPK